MDTANDAVSIVERLGIPLALIFFIGYLGYKYFIMKLSIMEKEFEHKIRGRKYRIMGKCDLKKEDGSTVSGEFDAELIEED